MFLFLGMFLFLWEWFLFFWFLLWGRFLWECPFKELISLFLLWGRVFFLRMCFMRMSLCSDNVFVRECFFFVLGMFVFSREWFFLSGNALLFFWECFLFFFLGVFLCYWNCSFFYESASFRPTMCSFFVLGGVHVFSGNSFFFWNCFLFCENVSSFSENPSFLWEWFFSVNVSFLFWECVFRECFSLCLGMFFSIGMFRFSWDCSFLPR